MTPTPQINTPQADAGETLGNGFINLYPYRVHFEGFRHVSSILRVGGGYDLLPLPSEEYDNIPQITKVSYSPVCTQFNYN